MFDIGPGTVCNGPSKHFSGRSANRNNISVYQRLSTWQTQPAPAHQKHSLETLVQLAETNSKSIRSAIT